MESMAQKQTSRLWSAFLACVVVAPMIATTASAAGTGPVFSEPAGTTVDRTPSGTFDDGGLGLLGTQDDGKMLPAVDDTGRYVLFHSEQGFIVPGDTNGFSDIFMRDREAGTLEVLSRPAGGQANGDSSFADMSGDARWVVFHSSASNLTSDDTNGKWDVFLLDRSTGKIELISKTADGTLANGNSFHASVSDDGRYVAFHSLATNLSAVDTDVDADIYVKDRQTGALELITKSTTGGPANGRAFVPDLSSDGRYVAFESEASNLVANDTNDKWDVFLADRQTGTIERVSLSAELGNGDNNSFLPQISADGRYVAFESFAENLIFGDTNGVADVYIYDRTFQQTDRMSVPYQVGADSTDRSLGVSITDDGQRAVFQSWAGNLVPGDANQVLDVFMFTLGDTAPIRISEVNGVGGNGPSELPTISGDGSTVVFESLASNLGPADDDGFWDAFAYDTATKTLVAASPMGVMTTADAFHMTNLDSTMFVDVTQGSYYDRGVGFLKANGITKGTSPNTYSPDAPVSRAQMATFLFRLNGSQWTLNPEPFTDVWGGSYFYEPVKWAYLHGITTGTSDTLYSPAAVVTRAQMAVFLWRLAGTPAVAAPHNFNDVPAGSYFEAAVRWLKQSGITTGTSPDTFSPFAAVTRAQMAAFILRLVETYGWTPNWVPR